MLIWKSLDRPSQIHLSRMNKFKNVNLSQSSHFKKLPIMYRNPVFTLNSREKSNQLAHQLNILLPTNFHTKDTLLESDKEVTLIDTTLFLVMGHVLQFPVHLSQL